MQRLRDLIGNEHSLDAVSRTLPGGSSRRRWALSMLPAPTNANENAANRCSSGLLTSFCRR